MRSAFRILFSVLLLTPAVRAQNPTPTTIPNGLPEWAYNIPDKVQPAEPRVPAIVHVPGSGKEYQASRRGAAHCGAATSVRRPATHHDTERQQRGRQRGADEESRREVVRRRHRRASNTITAERRDDIVLIGLNRPFIQNRLDPPSRARLSEVFQGR